MQRWDWSDETCVEIFLNEFLQSLLFECQKRVYRANQRLNTFFQIDFKVIRMMRSKNFSFSFAENIGKFMILRRDIGEIRSFCKFCGVSLNVWKVKTVLFDEPSNKQRVTGGVVDVFKWWVSTNSESTKQWVDPESTRARNRILLRWFWPRIKREIRETKSEWGSEKVNALSWIGLVAA